MNGRATSNRVLRRDPRYTPPDGAKCKSCGRLATIACPICNRCYCDDCLEVH